MAERLDNHLRDPVMVDTGGGSQMSRNELGCKNKDGITCRSPKISSQRISPVAYLKLNKFRRIICWQLRYVRGVVVNEVGYVVRDSSTSFRDFTRVLFQFQNGLRQPAASRSDDADHRVAEMK